MNVSIEQHMIITVGLIPFRKRGLLGLGISEATNGENFETPSQDPCVFKSSLVAFLIINLLKQILF